MRTVYLGTSEFAAAVLRRLAESPHRPALVVTRPDRPRGRGRKLASPPVADAARELGIALAQPASVNAPERVDTIAAARPEAVCVCAFGALITEPLLSALRDAERPPVAAAAVARRRPDRAGDHERRRGHRRVDHARSTAGSTAVRCARRRAEPIGPRRHLRHARGAARGARRRAARACARRAAAVRRPGRGARHLRRQDHAPRTASSTRRGRRSSSSGSCAR